MPIITTHDNRSLSYLGRPRRESFVPSILIEDCVKRKESWTKCFTSSFLSLLYSLVPGRLDRISRRPARSINGNKISREYHKTHILRVRSEVSGWRFRRELAINLIPLQPNNTHQLGPVALICSLMRCICMCAKSHRTLPSGSPMVGK